MKSCLNMGETVAFFDPKMSELGNQPVRVSATESIGARGEPGELKHLSTWRKGNHRDSLSSDERTGTRPVIET